MIALLIGALYAPCPISSARRLPCRYCVLGQDPIKVDGALQQRVEEVLQSAGVSPDSVVFDGHSVRARFDPHRTNQLKAKDAIEEGAGPRRRPALHRRLNLVSRSLRLADRDQRPPMYRGWTCRSGVHFMLQIVDMQAAITRRLSLCRRPAYRRRTSATVASAATARPWTSRVRDRGHGHGGCRNLIADQFPDLVVAGSPMARA